MSDPNMQTISHLIPTLSRSDISPFDFEENDINIAMLGAVPELVNTARESASHEADSYRGFHVGAAAVAYDTSVYSPRIGAYSAGSFKAKLDDHDYDPDHDVEEIPKVCAEMDIEIRANLHNMERIGVLVVAATSHRQRIHAVTDVLSATLHPCRDCEEVLRKSPLVDNNTIIMTVGAHADFYQVFNFESYKKLYSKFRKEGTYEDPDVYKYMKYVWSHNVEEYGRIVRKKRISGKDNAVDDHRTIKRRQAAYEAILAGGVLLQY